MLFGTIILVIGIALLLQTLGILNNGVWGFFWAILFIVVGVKMTMGNKKGKCVCDWFMRDKNSEDTKKSEEK